ncbi:unnamed protein product [Cuscuta epithymum]|uniref:Peptidase A1 domain-containing protein n=1 Tax=Cuscuta epithymum TaxID=186058 RepID=A0AAV0CE93_9ASTE|nr:unnamed protein product [Cuscuta epithymum]
MVKRWNICFVLMVLFLISSGVLVSGGVIHSFMSLNSNSSSSGIEMPKHPSFYAASSSASNSDCSFVQRRKSTAHHSLHSLERGSNGGGGLEPVKFNLKHRSDGQEPKGKKDSVFESTTRDLSRIQTLHTRITEKKNQNTLSRLKNPNPAGDPVVSSGSSFSGQLMATIGSGVSLGSGEYFMDVFVGTPPKHFSLILDTGSDLNWIQCVPCLDCFEQKGPYYDPKDSISFRNISCNDPRCHLVSSPDPPIPCKSDSQTCPYYYWYGDSSNTTGDFSLETFTVNLTTQAGKPEFRKVENVMFGCGHWNRGLFHGAAGLLGLGRGPLSFASQLQSFYGDSFSYCLVDRNSNSSISSKLIFGEDKSLLSHPQLNFTSLVSNNNSGKENPAETFYYVEVKSVLVGGEVVGIPEEMWGFSPEGAGGTIIDSGTTLSYFAAPAYDIIKNAFVEKAGKRYPVVHDFPILEPCYNVSGVKELDLPSFGVVFRDGAVWNFPVENYFIRIEPEEIVCLAILGTPKSGLSIIGNYQQQNFQILYDTKKSRLGFAPRKCSEA